MADQVEALEKEYCPPLDSALFHAIILDYDVSNNESLTAARLTLDAIRMDVDVENHTEFDPTGTSGFKDDTNVQSSAEALSSGVGDVSEGSRTPTMSTLSVGASSLTRPESSLTIASWDAGETDLNGIPQSEQIELLSQLFPAVKRFDIEFALKKSSLNFEKALDEVLSLAFFQGLADEDHGRSVVPRGVEGFASTGKISKKAKSRNRRKRFATNDDENAFALSDVENGATAQSRWEVAAKEIDFISKRSNIDPKVIASYYHRLHASFNDTVFALAEKELGADRKSLTTQAAVLESVRELHLEFPSLSTNMIMDLVILSHPSTAAAHELAKAAIHGSHLRERSREEVTGPTLKYSRPNLLDSEWTEVTKNTTFKNSVTMKLPSNAAERAAELAELRSSAFAQAAAAYKRSRSQPLMSAAAHYYAEVGRERGLLAKAYASAAADELVSKQSSGTYADLHGVSVQDGVRIALARVQQWWDAGYAEWSRSGSIMGKDGYRIVTGVGIHSEGGKAKLGPAVSTALKHHGWRVNEVVPGVLHVNGRVRR